MKVKTRAAMEWLDKQVEIAKGNGSDAMTTIKLRDNGRLDEGTVSDHFARNGFETRMGDKCVYVTPRGKSHTHKTQG